MNAYVAMRGYGGFERGVGGRILTASQQLPLILFYFARQTGSLYFSYLHSLAKLTNRNAYLSSVHGKYKRGGGQNSNSWTKENHK